MNERALAYANARAAELVGKKRIGGHLVDNPNPAWSIPQATRDMLRTEIAAAYEQGLSNDAIAEMLAESHAFSDARAEMIARTETAFADIEGNLQAYEASGQVAQKEWLTAADCCDECHKLNGVVVALGDAFPNGGGIGPPLHPNCRCDVLPVLIELD